MAFFVLFLFFVFSLSTVLRQFSFVRTCMFLQMHQNTPYNKAVDYWSVGLILYALVHGEVMCCFVLRWAFEAQPLSLVYIHATVTAQMQIFCAFYAGSIAIVAD